MKALITFTLLLVTPLFSFAQSKKNALYFIYDPSECQNCITEELNLSLSYYRMFPEQVVFIVENGGYKQKLQFLVSKLDFRINDESIIIDETTYHNYVKHPLQVYRDGKFTAYKLNTEFPDIFELKLIVDKVERTVLIPKRIDGFRCNLVSTNSNNVKLFYDEIGIICSTTDTINLVDKIDTVEVLSALHLSETDLRLTFNEIKQTKGITQSLFQILAPVTTTEKDFLYFSTMVTYSHQLTGEEIAEIRKTSKKYNKMLLNAVNEGVTILKHELFISKFDLNYNYIESYIVGSQQDGYDKDFPSPFYKNGNEFIGNLHWYKTDSIKHLPYPTYGHYRLENDSIRFEKADVFNRPDFYEKEGFDNNCANTQFSQVGSSIVYYYVAYPCAIDVTNHVRYEVPMKDIKAVCSLEKQKFHAKGWIKYYTLGLVHLQDNIHLLLFREYQSEQIYYGIFNEEGEYFGFGKMEHSIPMNATTTLNGELINILDSEIQFMRIGLKQ